MILKTREIDTQVLKLTRGISQITYSLQKQVISGNTNWLPLNLLLELLENLWGINTAENLWCQDITLSLKSGARAKCATQDKLTLILMFQPWRISCPLSLHSRPEALLRFHAESELG